MKDADFRRRGGTPPTNTEPQKQPGFPKFISFSRGPKLYKNCTSSADLFSNLMMLTDFLKRFSTPTVGGFRQNLVGELSISVGLQCIQWHWQTRD